MSGDLAELPLGHFGISRSDFVKLMVRTQRLCSTKVRFPLEVSDAKLAVDERAHPVRLAPRVRGQLILSSLPHRCDSCLDNDKEDRNQEDGERA